MVMRPDVLAAAIDAAQAGGSAAPMIYLTPRGVPLKQSRVRDIAAGAGANVFVAGSSTFKAPDIRAAISALREA